MKTEELDANLQEIAERIMFKLAADESFNEELANAVKIGITVVFTPVVIAKRQAIEICTRVDDEVKRETRYCKLKCFVDMIGEIQL